LLPAGTIIGDLDCKHALESTDIYSSFIVSNLENREIQQAKRVQASINEIPFQNDPKYPAALHGINARNQLN
jgi:hypothetical protein